MLFHNDLLGHTMTDSQPGIFYGNHNRSGAVSIQNRKLHSRYKPLIKINTFILCIFLQLWQFSPSCPGYVLVQNHGIGCTTVYLLKPLCEAGCFESSQPSHLNLSMRICWISFLTEFRAPNRDRQLISPQPLSLRLLLKSADIGFVFRPDSRCIILLLVFFVCDFEFRSLEFICYLEFSLSAK